MCCAAYASVSYLHVGCTAECSTLLIFVVYGLFAYSASKCGRVGPQAEWLHAGSCYQGSANAAEHETLRRRFVNARAVL
jgi:hypothetical protein